MNEKASFLARTGVRKNSYVALGFSSIKINYFEYPKRFINRINEGYDFSIKYRYSDILLEKHNFICKRLIYCNHTFYWVGMVSVTSASRYEWQQHIIKVDPRYTSEV